MERKAHQPFNLASDCHTTVVSRTSDLLTTPPTPTAYSVPDALRSTTAISDTLAIFVTSKDGPHDIGPIRFRRRLLASGD